MGNIIAALLIGGFATMLIVWPYGVLPALIAASFGGSLLAIIVAVGDLLLKRALPDAQRFKKDLPDADRQKH